jgi:hypothetical protein
MRIDGFGIEKIWFCKLGFMLLFFHGCNARYKVLDSSLVLHHHISSNKVLLDILFTQTNNTPAAPANAPATPIIFCCPFNPPGAAAAVLCVAAPVPLVLLELAALALLALVALALLTLALLALAALALLTLAALALLALALDLELTALA